MSKNKVHRRDFLKTTAAGAAALFWALEADARNIWR